MLERTPYVGEGADGCRRSAQIDREEAELLPEGDGRFKWLIASVVAWEQQAARLEQE